MRKLLVVAAVVALVGAGNLLAWRSVANPDAAELDGLWADLARARLAARADLPAELPAEVRALEGERVTLTGVAFVTDAGLDRGDVRWCVLLPPSRYGCCGTTCDPRPELSVFVDCAETTWRAGEGRQVRAEVTGVLRAAADGASWCLWTLEDAEVRPLGP